MTIRGIFVAIGIGVCACYQPDVVTGAPCADNGACPSGLECRAGTCERPGGGDAPRLDAAPDACATAMCQGNDLVGCGPVMTCTTSCSSIGGAHCTMLVPSNGLSSALLAGATANVTSTQDWSFNTDDGEIKKGNAILRGPGTGVIAGINFAIVNGTGVFSAQSFQVSQGARFEGNGDHPLVLFAAATIQIAGEIDVGGDLQLGGPGGLDGTSSALGTECHGRAGRYFMPGFGEGGGGGGGRTAGGSGGPSNTIPSQGLGGELCSARATTIPLRGGAGGGHGGSSLSNAGGGGGGALGLVAMQSITVTGAVGSPGAGGRSGSGPEPSGDGGGGGGGGGAVFLEAPSVTVSGALTANGGGGAAPFAVNGARGSLTTATAAAGGSYAGPAGTRSGGRGGTGTLSPHEGQNYTADNAVDPPTVIISRGGGGGGAAGRIEIKSLMIDTTSAVLSPAPATSTATLE